MGQRNPKSGDLERRGNTGCFDYAGLDAQTTRVLRVSAKRIRFLVNRSLGDVIAIGQELILVKQTLPHGQFLLWMEAEFGWQERSARNFISVANRFKSATVADLEIDLSAAYLLAAPSVPESVRDEAVERAEKGERISRAVARKIIAEANGEVNPSSNGGKQGIRKEAFAKLGELKKKWPDDRMDELVGLLREFADKLERS